MQRVKLFIILAVLLIVSTTGLKAATDDCETFYYAIEKKGVLSGFFKVSVCDSVIEGRPVITVYNDIESHVIALGASVDSYMNFGYYVDPQTNQYFYHTSLIDQGTFKMGSELRIIDDTVFIDDITGDKVDTIFITADAIRECLPLFSHLLKKFENSDITDFDYQKFSEIDGFIHDVNCSKVGTEKLELVDKSYDAVVLSVLDRTIGIRSKIWLEAGTGYMLKSEVADAIYFLADSTVVNRIEKADLDESLFSKVDLLIPDIKSITYMKVYAILEPAGVWITNESLNIPGQSFTGTVEENHIDGVFELTYPRYDGSQAPPFPNDYSADPTLKKYLEPEDLIEADDPEIIKKAREITEGASDSWDAVKRLSQWISDEISYDIPGGGNASNTLKIRLGECGSHSRLMTAFCRAVGIPARMIWGCLYTSNYGGSFGQHAWNEIYMGAAGWIPIDATAEEIDYVDCGHIRLGEAETKTIFFNPIDMTIVDYRADEIDPLDLELYQKYLGKYQGPMGVFEVLVQNGSLGVDIPNQTIYELKNPDENGVWVFKLTDLIEITFQEDADKVSGMTLVQDTRIPRNADPGIAIDSGGVPKEYQTYLGAYSVPMQGFDLTVLYKDDNLYVNDPSHGDIRMDKTDINGRWIDEFKQNEISFDLDEDGNSIAIIFHGIVRMNKIE